MNSGATPNPNESVAAKKRGASNANATGAAGAASSRRVPHLRVSLPLSVSLVLALFFLSAAGAFFFASAPNASAVNTSAGSGDWFVDGNWDLGTPVATSADPDVRIDGGDSITIAAGAAATPGNLLIGFTTDGTLTVSGGGTTLNVPTGPVTVGDSGATGVLDVQGGLVTFEGLFTAGSSATSTGTVTVSGGRLDSSATGTATANAIFGSSGNGTLEVSGGTYRNNPTFIGVANIEDAGGGVASRGEDDVNIIAGNAGNLTTGSLIVNNGLVQSAQDIILGNNSAAVYTQTGGTVEADANIVFGAEGNAVTTTVDISGGVLRTGQDGFNSGRRTIAGAITTAVTPDTIFHTGGELLLGEEADTNAGPGANVVYTQTGGTVEVATRVFVRGPNGGTTRRVDMNLNAGVFSSGVATDGNNMDRVDGAGQNAANFILGRQGGTASSAVVDVAGGTLLHKRSQEVADALGTFNNNPGDNGDIIVGAAANSMNTMIVRGGAGGAEGLVEAGRSLLINTGTNADINHDPGTLDVRAGGKVLVEENIRVGNGNPNQDDTASVGLLTVSGGTVMTGITNINGIQERGDIADAQSIDFGFTGGLTTNGGRGIGRISGGEVISRGNINIGLSGQGLVTVSGGLLQSNATGAANGINITVGLQDTANGRLHVTGMGTLHQKNGVGGGDGAITIGNFNRAVGTFVQDGGLTLVEGELITRWVEEGISNPNGTAQGYVFTGGTLTRPEAFTAAVTDTVISVNGDLVIQDLAVVKITGSDSSDLTSVTGVQLEMTEGFESRGGNGMFDANFNGGAFDVSSLAIDTPADDFVTITTGDFFFAQVDGGGSDGDGQLGGADLTTNVALDDVDIMNLENLLISAPGLMTMATITQISMGTITVTRISEDDFEMGNFDPAKEWVWALVATDRDFPANGFGIGGEDIGDDIGIRWSLAPIPEPAGPLLLFLGLSPLLIRRRRRG